MFVQYGIPVRKIRSVQSKASFDHTFYLCKNTRDREPMRIVDCCKKCLPSHRAYT